MPGKCTTTLLPAFLGQSWFSRKFKFLALKVTVATMGTANRNFEYEHVPPGVLRSELHACVVFALELVLMLG